jgi:tetratricopeptide (TPR) repeat protein
MHSKILTLLVCLLTCASAFCQSNDYASLARKGIKALEQDSLSRAEALFLQAIDQKPTDTASATLYQYIGQIRVRQRRYDEAMMAFKYGLQITPASEELLMDKASLNIQTGNDDLAINDLNDILTLNPNHAEALFFRAYLYASQRLNAKARSDYERLVTLQPQNRQARLGLAILCDNDKRPQEAMEHIDILLRYWPKDAAVYAIRGGMYQKRRQYEQALSDMNHAIELDPKNPDFFISRALLYKDFRKTSLATADFRKAIELGASAEECASMMLEADDNAKNK